MEASISLSGLYRVSPGVSPYDIQSPSDAAFAAFQRGNYLGGIFRLPAGDQIVIHHHLGIFPLRACVNDVIFDGEKAGGAATLEHVGGAQHPSAMTDAGNQFALRVHIVHEFIGGSVPADVIRSVSSGNHDTVEVRPVP